MSGATLTDLLVGAAIAGPLLIAFVVWIAFVDRRDKKDR